MYVYIFICVCVCMYVYMFIYIYIYGCVCSGVTEGVLGGSNHPEIPMPLQNRAKLNLIVKNVKNC